uniref:Uncharacterized protein n=1 Tax=Bos indicus x Bos taurus TaxID=30522 RepID=A0A4W2IDV2_BOBOX
MKLFSTLLIIREMQIRTTRTYRLIPVTMATIEKTKDVQKESLLSIVAVLVCIPTNSVRGMLWGGRREGGSGWGTRVYLLRIHFDVWQNQYNIVKFKNKLKKKRNHLCTIERNVNWYSHYGKQYGGSSKKLKTELVHDPALPLLHIYLKEITLLPQRDICTPMFTATLFTIATIWKQLKYPLNTEWVKKTRYIYSMLYYSDIKKKEILPFATTCIDLEGSMLREMSEKDKYYVTILICGILRS